MVAREDRPTLAPKARLGRDRVTGGAMLLYPERGLALNAVAEQIVRRLDGSRTVGAIAEEVARACSADVAIVEQDTLELLRKLAARGLLEGVVAEAADERSTDALAADHPYTLIAELTYRCPLRCPYCSNPTSLAHEQGELTTEAWARLFEEAAALGIAQIHFTGGEPLARTDLEALVAHARALGLYTNLITSGLPLSEARLRALVTAGLDHVQLSIQAADAELSDRIAGRTSFARKLEVAAWVKDAKLPLTVNVVLHRDNVDHVEAIVALAERLSADRLELANVQYLGWALANRGALLPTREQLESARVLASAARERLRGRLEIVFVMPDYFSDRPRPCMDGWARRYVHVSPDGLVLPCHAAHTIPGLVFERAGERPLAEIWKDAPGLAAFRGDAWMPEPCASCDRKHVDYGGCRCQAFHLAGDARATDPACSLSPRHALIEDARLAAGKEGARRYLYRTSPRIERG